jgi:hypothetical protein
MDSGKALFVNLAKRRIGEDTSTSMLLGSLLVTKIERPALSRANTLAIPKNP